MNMQSQSVFSRGAARAEVMNAFMRGVYGWMTAGLGLTAAASLFVAGSPTIQQAVFGNPVLFWGCIIAEFALVMWISAGIQRMSAGTASGLFLLYSALNGVTLSVVFLAYAPAAVFKAFVTTAGMFGAMSIYGLTTKRDLTSWGSFLFMGLIGMLIAMVVNIFMQSPALHFIISGVGVLIFTGLTAYDTQKLREMGTSAPYGDSVAIRRGSILGALTLYLDFINLFLMLLRFFGASRD